MNVRQRMQAVIDAEAAAIRSIRITDAYEHAVELLKNCPGKVLTTGMGKAGHIARNAAIPWITVLLPEIPNILTGSIFIEEIFRVPGLGSYFVTSTISRDYPLILALTLLIAVLWGLTYLITDILYTILDPRIRLTSP